MPLSLLFHPPAILLTRIVTGWPATLIYAVFAGINLYVGIGLLRVKPPVCVIGIGYFLFTFVNSAVFYLAPGARNRVLSLMDAENSIFPWMKAWPGKVEPSIDPPPMMLFGGLAGGGVSSSCAALLSR